MNSSTSLRTVSSSVASPLNRNSGGWGRRNGSWIAPVVLLSIQLALTIRLFGSFEALTNDDPVISVDYALHLYHGSIGSTFLRNHGANWGYDPFEMAGYPKSAFHDPSAGLSDLFQLLAGGGYRPRAFKLGLASTIVFVPILIWIGVKNLGWSNRLTLIVVSLALVYYWGGFSRILLDSGLFGFIFASTGNIFLIGLATAWYRRPGVANWACLAGAVSFHLFAHPTSAIILFPGMLGFYAAASRRLSIRGHFALWSAVVVALLANLFWIVPAFHLIRWKTEQFSFMNADPNEGWYPFIFLINESPISTLYLVGGLLGLGRMFADERRTVWFSVACSFFGLLGLTLFGSMFAMTRAVEPLRFQTPFCLVASIPFGYALSTLVARQGWSTPIRTICSIAYSLVIIGVAARFELRPNRPLEIPSSALPVSLRPATKIPTGRPPLRTIGAIVAENRPLSIGLTDEMRDLVERIRSITTNDHRILFENQLRLREATIPESVHWTPLLPILTDRQFVGGQYHCAPILHNKICFGDYELGGRRVDRYSTSELSDYCDRYNVGWIVCWSTYAESAFKNNPAFKLIESIPRYATPGLKRGAERASTYFIFEKIAKSNWFLQGEGTVADVNLNNLTVEHVSPKGGRIVIKYHWHDALAASNGETIERVEVAGDPVGFIGVRIDGPKPSIRIFNSYRFNSNTPFSAQTPVTPAAP